MADVSRWNPFKFRRKKAEEKQPAPAPERKAVPAPLANHPMQRWMESVFDDPFFRQPFAGFGELDRWFGDFSPAVFQPSVDVVDEEEALKVSAELPGMDKDDVQLRLEDGALVIRGEKRNEEESRENGCYRTERSYGFFQRRIPLPSDVDEAQADARFDRGVLTIRFPKTGAPPASERTIDIQ